MSYVCLQRIRLQECGLPTKLYSCAFQDGYSKSIQRKLYLHSSSRRRQCPAWSHRYRIAQANRISPLCYNTSSILLPHPNHGIYTLWDLSWKHSFHTTAYFCKENGTNEAKNEQKVESEILKTLVEDKQGNDKAKAVVVKLTFRQKISRFHANASKVGYVRYVWNGFKGFLIHMKDGFKLFWLDLTISAPLLWKYIQKGRSSMKRREYKQLTRTLADLIKMIPLIASVVIPFGEIAMPFLIAKGFMPKAFISKEQQNDRDRQKLQKKLEYGALLSESLKQMSRKTDHKDGTASLEDFLLFIDKVKSREIMPTNNEILKFSHLFEDTLTLEDLRVDQLQGLCKLIGIDLIGQIPNERILRFQIDMRLRELMVDDLEIQKEGLSSLAVWELQQACRARGMRAVGVSEERLRHQLQQWLELHLKEKVPSSLLLLSRLIYLDENLSLTEALTQTISGLPESTVDKVIVQSSEALGDAVDKKAKIKMLHEERKILKKQEQKEKQEKEAEKAAAKQVEVAPAPAAPAVEAKVEPEKPAVAKEEVLVDKAEPLKDIAELLVDHVVEAPKPDEKLPEEVVEPETDITSQDLGDIEKAIEDMSRHEKDEIEDVKGDFADYSETVRSLSLKEEKVESKGALKLQQKLGNYLDDLSTTIDTLNEQRHSLQEKLEIEQVKLKHKEEIEEKEELKEAISAKKRNLVSINEVLLSLRRLQKLPDDVRMQKVLEVLDDDHDGMIDINDVLKVTEELIRENLKINKAQVGTMMNLLRKEEELEEERKIQEREDKEEKVSKDTTGDECVVVEDDKTQTKNV